MNSRELAHELRTPINHIVGYSEMLMEDLAADPGSDGYRAIAAVRAAARDMLTAVNGHLGRGADSVVPAEVLAGLRAAIQSGVEQLSSQRIDESSLAQSPASASDVAKILGACGRLSQFAATGDLSPHHPTQP